MPHLRSGRALCLPAMLAVVGLLTSACAPDADNRLSVVQKSGRILVLTRNSPTTYYEGPDSYVGFEYDLASAFARHLGVSLQMKTVARFSEIIPRVARGEADFAAAGLTVTASRAAQVRFTPHYQTIRQQVVYHTRTAPPSGPAALAKRQIEVIAGTSYVERLEQLKAKIPDLGWVEVDNMETEEVLLHVQDGLTEFTVADSNIVALFRQFYPDIRVAFDLNEDEKLAWAFPPDEDDSLFQEASRFIESMRASGALAQLIERHYGAATRFNPINIAAYLQKIDTDLQQFRPLFQAAGRRYQLDWRLLAALSYQESYWDPKAVSPTGVRGMMMLTENTARHLGVVDRLDPRQSIFGGAAYLRSQIDRMPDRIPEPDRTWMAMAAYNVGYGHLEDARIITQAQQADPDKWNDVQQHLPLLAKTTWYSKTKHGYARGYEPVQFVTRIRTYYEVLKKIVEDERQRNNTDVMRLRAPAL